MDSYIIAGTGHRPNKIKVGSFDGYSPMIYDLLVEFAEIKLNQFRWPPGEIISGMALGWDQALAEAALRLDIPLIAAVPFEGQESKWPRESQKRYNWILSKAHDVVIVSPGPYSPNKLHDRNEWMVDNCNLLLTLWDGSEGGTKACINYAEWKGREMHHLWDEWLTHVG